MNGRSADTEAHIKLGFIIVMLIVGAIAGFLARFLVAGRTAPDTVEATAKHQRETQAFARLEDRSVIA